MGINKKTVIIIILTTLIFVALFLLVNSLQKPKEIRSRANQTTVLFLEPTSTAEAPMNMSLNETKKFEIWIDPGTNSGANPATNYVSYVHFTLLYDPNKLQPADSTPFTINSTAFPVILEGPIYTPGKIFVTLAIGANTSKAIAEKTLVGNLFLKAVDLTSDTPTSITFDSTTEVLSISPNDQAQENVLSTTNPEYVRIDPIPTNIALTNLEVYSLVLSPDNPHLYGNMISVTSFGVKNVAGATVSKVKCQLTVQGAFATWNGSIIIPPEAGTLEKHELTCPDIVFSPALAAGMSDNLYGLTTYLPSDKRFYYGTYTFQFTVIGVNDPNSANNIKIVTFTIPEPTAISTATPTTIPKLGINYTVYLHGIGNSGDNTNPAFSMSNKNPLHTQRNTRVEIWNSSTGIVIATRSGTVNYISSNGNFTGYIDFGTSIPSGKYLIKITSNSYLRNILGIYDLTVGQDHNLLPNTAVHLVTGDIDNNNALDILDYNILYGCYTSDLFPTPRSCDDTKKVLADLNDDGNVNQYDINLFVRELSVQQGK